MPHRQSIFHWIGVMSTACLFGASVGCSSKYENLKAFVQGHEHGDVGASTYRIEPPDVVSITSPTASEVDGVFQTVGMDGKVSLKLVGDVKVSRLTPREAAAKMEDVLSQYYVEPKVHVRIASFRSKKIYVLGQVDRRGPIPYTGRDTLLSVLAAARPNFLAWGAQVRVIRPSAKESTRHEIIIDVDKIMQEGDLRGNMLLQPGDIIYVPPTPLGWLGLRIREVLFPISPMEDLYSSPLDFMQSSDNYDDRFGSD